MHGRWYFNENHHKYRVLTFQGHRFKGQGHILPAESLLMFLSYSVLVLHTVFFCFISRFLRHNLRTAQHRQTVKAKFS